MRVSVPLKDAYRLINHGPTTLVTTCEPSGERPNVMAAAWAMPLDFDPPKVAVVVATGTFTRELLDRTGELVLSIPTVTLVEQTYAAGSVTGREHDKWSELGLEREPASRVKPPLVAGCVAWLECKALADERPVLERHDLWLGEVVAAWADDEVYRDREWRFTNGDPRRTIHHVARGVFLAAGERVEAKKRR
jgi:flavin reductase (DIM6/NTAB) family NADH-FMN oxidoreductase RutF